MTIAGVPALQLRDAFKKFGSSSWSAACLATRLGLDVGRGTEVAAELLEDQFVERAGQSAGVAFFQTTIKGSALALASAARPITRATADRLVSDVIRRAEGIEADDGYFFRVKRLVVFGSYLTVRPTLGDVDIAVELSQRFAGQVYQSGVNAALDRADAEGRRVPGLRQAYLPYEEIYRVLRGRSKSISIHSITDAVLESAATREIYYHP